MSRYTCETCCYYWVEHSACCVVPSAGTPDSPQPVGTQSDRLACMHYVTAESFEHGQKRAEFLIFKEQFEMDQVRQQIERAGSSLAVPNFRMERKP